MLPPVNQRSQVLPVIFYFIFFIDDRLFENDVQDEFDEIDSEGEKDYAEDRDDDDDDYYFENSFDNDVKGISICYICYLESQSPEKVKPSSG